MFETLFSLPRRLAPSSTCAGATQQTDDTDLQETVGNQGLVERLCHRQVGSDPAPLSDADAFLAQRQAAAAADGLGMVGEQMYDGSKADRTAALDQILIDTGLAATPEALDEHYEERPGDFEFCGRFVTWLYGREGFDLDADGGRMSSGRKALNYFLYRDHRGRPVDPDVRSEHEAQGSTRQHTVLQGTAGEDYFNGHTRTYGDDTPVPQPIDQNLDIRPGDEVVAFYDEEGEHHEHVMMVTAFDPETLQIEIVEGNNGEDVQTRTLDLLDPDTLAHINGIGRLAAGDLGYEPPVEEGQAPLHDTGEAEGPHIPPSR